MLVGLLGACAVLLGAAGLMKLIASHQAAAALFATRLPGADRISKVGVIRLAGAGELAVALGNIFLGGRVPAALLAVAYCLLGFVAWRLVRRAPGQDCGCFGGSAAPASNWHIVVNTVAAVIAIVATTWPPPAIVAQLAQGGVQAIVLPAVVILLAWSAYLLMTALPELVRLNAKVASLE
jgi:hypothetical protein